MNMPQMESYIDIMKEVKLPIEEVDFAITNPENLTKEGADFSLSQWKTGSKNRYVIQKYELMIRKCKSFSSSGKTTDGKTVLARDDSGKPVWTEKME